MKIAIIRREYLTTLDGVNRFIFTLADGLNELRHEVHVMSYSFHKNPFASLYDYARNFFDSEGSIKIHTLTANPTDELWARIALTWLWKGSKLLDKLDVTAVILNGIIPLKTEALKIAVNHGVFHGNFARSKGLKKQVFLQFAKHLYRHDVDCRVCVSSRLAKELKTFMGLDFHVLPLPIKLHLYKNQNLNQRYPTIIHIGTRPGKNAELSIHTLKLLLQKGIDVKLIVVGTRSTYAENLRIKYSTLIPPKNLEFCFDAPSNILRELLSTSRVFLLPSRYEAFPYTILEAFASGLPAVVSEAVPSQLVVDGFNGFRLSGFNPQFYATKLAYLLTDDTLWHKMSDNASKTVESFSHVKVAKHYENLIVNLAESKR